METTSPPPLPITPDTLAVAAGEFGEAEPKSDSPKAVPLMEMRTDPPEGAELLKSRMLYRAEGMIVMGPTGSGKSVISIGAGLHWGCGRPYLGITPSGPLKILIVEAEDVEWTNGFMRDGALADMEPIEEEEIELLNENVILCETRSHIGADFFRKVLRPLLEEHRPDLVFINPAFSYLGGEANSGVDVAEFLRAGLNPLLEEFDCGGVVFHHTNKLPGIESQRMKEVNPLYMASGHNEWNNWPRVGLAMMPTSDPDIMVLVATKRSKAAGWVDDKGNITDRCYIQRSADPSKPAWVQVGAFEARASIAEASPKKAGRRLIVGIEDVEAVALEAGSKGLQKADLILRCMERTGAAESTIKGKVSQAHDLGLIVVIDEIPRVKADGTPEGGHKIKIMAHADAIDGNFPAIDNNPSPD